MNRQQPQTDMLEQIQRQILSSLADSVHWFQAEMPAYYFAVTEPAEQARHLEVVHALRRAREARLTMIDDGEAGKLLFFGRPSAHTLLDVVAMLGERPFHRVELHTSRDQGLFIYAFIYGTRTVPAGVDLVAHRKAIINECCRGQADCIRPEVVARYLDAVDQGYLARSRVERVARHIRAWSTLTSAEDVHVAIDEIDDVHPVTRVLVASGGLKPWQFLTHLARVIQRHGLHLERGYLDWVPAVAGGERVLISTLYVVNDGAKPLNARIQHALAGDLAGMQRQYSDGLVARYQDGTYSLRELELLRAALGFVGQVSGPDYPYLDVAEVGEETAHTEVALCHELCALLDARFEPGATVSRRAWERRLHQLQKRVHACEPASHAVILEGVLGFIAAMQITNLYRPQRLGLAFKLDPAVLPAARFPNRPFGLFFFFSHLGKGFHIRFRASARGGLRLVLPRNAGTYQRAREQLLKEVYDLAWAQQLKNKDIPEGGSKCIALVEPPSSGNVDANANATAMVKQIADPLLDLILPAEAVPEVIGPHGEWRAEDLIFLGPDENMTPDRILWVAHRAAERGLPHHLTLMSSKPGSGINHKEFGVTSEGLFRWIDLVLPVVGIEAGQPYTVKITGGPDGDLGGNLLRILHREHAARCKVVAVADGTGYAADPKGLDWSELLRLVKESQGIAKFDGKRLSAEGRMAAATDKASEAIRNGLHNTVKADLFVPCGGRPYTINDQNWQEFLTADGKPNARAMVEGANIFLTPAARRGLEDSGLVVIKDSSANKGGVICSSYEVLAGLVLSEEEFIAEKKRFVAEVIALLRAAADAEGKSLLAAWIRRGKTLKLSELSQQISEEINRVSGLFEKVIEAHLDDRPIQPAWRRHLEAHCPPLLVEKYRNRIHDRIPRAHRVAILSKHLASNLVYREGLTWCRAYLQGDRLWLVLSTYLAAEEYVRTVVEAIAPLKFKDQPELIRIIEAGSQRELVRQRLGEAY